MQIIYFHRPIIGNKKSRRGVLKTKFSHFFFKIEKHHKNSLKTHHCDWIIFTEGQLGHNVT